MEKIYEDILLAVKSNNVELFSSLIEQKRGNLSLCFGRFPILSICYLYESRKIIKTYERELSSVWHYTFAEEDSEVYEKFRTLAGKCLRFYVFEGNTVVSPLEMLAIMENSTYLMEKYPVFSKNAIIKANIQKIYSLLYNQDIKIEGEEIFIKRSGLSKFQKTCVLVTLIVTVFMIAFSGVAWNTVYKFSGRGTEDSPYKIAGEKQLIKALEAGGNYIITRDITMSSAWEAKEFSGNLDGGGYTIFVKDRMQNGFVSVLTGNISNVKFVFSDINKEVTDNTALLIKTNSGKIKNMQVSVSGSFTDNSEAENLYVSCMVYENNGEITDCSFEGNISFIGNGAGNAYLSGLVSINNSLIQNCSTTAISKFSTDTVDVAGLVAENGEAGTVTGCENNAEVMQTTASKAWLPNAGGVAISNYGNMINCINNGKISAVSTASEATLDVYAGGAACINYNQMTKCKNTAEIFGSSNSFNVYAGGVAAVNNDIIDNCCSYGQISVASTVTENVYLFAGGITGYNISSIKNSYSASTFNTLNTNVFLGGVMGVVYYYGESQNNFFIKQSNTAYGAATILMNNVLYAGSDVGVTAVADIVALKTQEVYWG